MNDEAISEIKAKSRAAWRNWLAKHHNTQERVWLIIAKKSSKLLSVNMTEAIAEALCYGWIDSRKKGIDEQTYKVYFTPRKPKSQWSTANKHMVEILLKENLIAAPGLKAIEEAKEHGLY